MLTSWLRDLTADQFDDPSHAPPLFVPDIPVNLPFPIPPGRMLMAGWGDAAVVVPWVICRRPARTPRS